MRKFSAILMVLFCFLTVSCSNLFGDKVTERGSITITVPSCKSGTSSARAAENEPFPDNHFWIALNRGDEFVQGDTIAAGESISFDGLEPGVYNLYGWGLVDDLAYEGTQADIVVEAGKDASATLTLKIMDFNNPKLLLFTYEANKPEYNRYLTNISKRLLKTPFKKNSIVKVTVSGIPSEDFNGEMNYFYGGLVEGKDDAWEVLENMNPVSVKANRKKGERYTDTFTFMVTGEPKEGSIPWLGVWYSAEAMNKPMKVTDVQFSYEYVDECLPDFITAKSTSKGLELTVKRPAGVTAWNSMEFKTKDSKMYMTPMGQDDSEEFTVTWPFVSSGEAYIFDFGANFNNEWAMYKCAAVYTGEDTGKEMNDSLLKKIASSTAEIGEDYQLHFNTELTISDFNSITNIPNLEYNAISGMYAGEMWEKWVDEFDLHGINEINDLINSRLNMTEIRYLISSNIKELIERFEGREYYAVDIRIRFEAKDYPNQYFMFKNIQAEHCPVIVPPAEKVVTLESGSYTISEPISEEVDAGDYVLVKFSGDFCYEGDSEFETEIRGILYIDDTDICTMDDVWIEETITQNKTVNFSYGFYVREAFPGDAIIEIVVSRTGGDIPPDYITIKNYQCEIEVQKEVDGKVTLVMPGATAELPLLLDFISTMELDEPGAASSYVVTISGNADSNIAGNLTCAMVVGVPRTGGAVNQKVVTLSPNAIDLSPGDITRELFFDFTNMDDGIAGPCDSYLTLTFDLDAAKSGGKISDFSITITKQ